jgi:predicted enzyme related to lactoylglutathione lyase
MNENNSRIDYLEFAARDLTVAKKFYSTVFGWKFTDYGPDYTSFHDGRNAGGFRPETAPPGPMNPLVVIFASQLEKSLAEVVAGGGKITAPPFEFPGGRRFHFTDPNGLELGVWSDLRPDGSKIE